MPRGEEVVVPLATDVLSTWQMQSALLMSSCSAIRAHGDACLEALPARLHP